ncbi:hypothetical protein GCM10014715_09010 [Streptomyces spiralis]|uniref:DinB family protein n=2 Tax=Streptomyces spiralis TaxID=66376 RepID=A0A919DLW7_9ACTN|nr:hypothetical protein GCM10014715_09010 [Streptomyces spiralis]
MPRALLEDQGPYGPAHWTRARDGYWINVAFPKRTWTALSTPHSSLTPLTQTINSVASGVAAHEDARMESIERMNEPEVTRWTQATVYPDMWVDPDEDPRESDAESVDERSTLLDGLRHYRLTMEMKCAGLDAEQMAVRAVPPSTMSLLGLVRHMAEDERHFRRLAGEDSPRIYRTAEDRDGDWNGATADPAVVEDAWRQWRAEMELTDRFIARFPDLGTRPGGDAQLRDILVMQIAEYARHCGHADLLRERIDGRVGQ